MITAAPRNRSKSVAAVGALVAVSMVVKSLSTAPAFAAGVHDILGPVALRIGAIAFAIGLDVLALAIGIGVTGVPWNARIRVGAAFAGAEISMQLLGLAIGTGAGHLVGELAAYTGFGLLALIGLFMLKESFDAEPVGMSATSGWGLLAASASISLDSLGVGFSLPSLGVPLVPLFATVAATTVAFTLAGLAFGAMLGQRARTGAERACGIVLILLAIVFTLQHVRH